MGFMGGGETGRKRWDFYPTPFDVTTALMVRMELELVACANMLDPAAGEGAIIRACRELRGEDYWTAIEIDESHEDALEDVAENVIIGDALRLPWPAAHVIANPPFNQLDEFWPRVVAHRDKYARACAVLVPVAWISAEKRRAYVRPDAIFQLGWRPVFHQKTGPAHKGSQDFAWFVLHAHPTNATRWERIERP